MNQFNEFTRMEVKKRILKQVKNKYSCQYPLYDVDVRHCIDEMYVNSEYCLIELTRACYQEDIGVRYVSAVATLFVPDTWWDHFKQDVLPHWVLAYLKPINYREERVTVTKHFDVKASFPDYVPPNGLKSYIIIQETTLENHKY